MKNILKKLEKAGFKLWKAAPYPVWVLSFIKSDAALVNKLLPGAVPDGWWDKYSALCGIHQIPGGVLIALGVLDNYCSDTTIVHECVHAKNRLFRYVGVQLDTDNDEAEAYLLDDMFPAVKAELKRRKKLKAKAER
jgi:hypothetical protein